MFLNFEKLILFLIFFLSQIYLISSLPSNFAKKYTPEAIEARVQNPGIIARLNEIRKKALTQNFLKKDFKKDGKSKPFENWFLAKIYHEKTKKLLVYFLTFVSFIFSSILFVNITSRINNLPLKFAITLFIVLSNPSLALIIFEPYSLLAFSLLFLFSQEKSFLCYLIAGLLNPLLSFIFFLSKTLVTESKSIVLSSFLSLLLIFSFYIFALNQTQLLNSLDKLGILEIILVLSVPFINSSKLSFFKSFLVCTFLFKFDPSGVYPLFSLMILIFDHLGKKHDYV